MSLIVAELATLHQCQTVYTLDDVLYLLDVAQYRAELTKRPT